MICANCGDRIDTSLDFCRVVFFTHPIDWDDKELRNKEEVRESTVFFHFERDCMKNYFGSD